MGTNRNNEIYEANQREANHSPISGFDMQDKIEITDLSRKSHGILGIHPKYILYAANENGEVRDAYTGEKCYEKHRNLYLIHNFGDGKRHIYVHSVFV